jgi:hypothetical protein
MGISTLPSIKVSGHIAINPSLLQLLIHNYTLHIKVILYIKIISLFESKAQNNFNIGRGLIMLKSHLTVVFSKVVMMIAVKVAVVVGTILARINHGHKIVNGTLSPENIVQIQLTYVVPYCVSP